jgi:hypothetical protein
VWLFFFAWNEYDDFMLKVFSGNDFSSRKKAVLLHTKESQENGSYRRHAGELTISILDPYFSESLFGETYTVVFDGISLFSGDVQDFLLAHVSEMHGSENTFLVVDEKFSKEWKDEFKKHKVSHEEYSQKESFEGGEVFRFTDLYLSRNKKEAWMTYTRLIRGGSAPEEVHGALFWAVKSLFLVVSGALGGTPEELNMKPYPYQKMKGFSSKWEKGEIKNSLRALSELLEFTRKQGGDLNVSLERFLLS